MAQNGIRVTLKMCLSLEALFDATANASVVALV